MQVATKVVAPTTVTNTTVGWRRSYMRLEKPSALWAISPRPRTWNTTVSTIRGTPHAQSAVQFGETTATILPTDWSIIIVTSFACSLDLKPNCRWVALKGFAPLPAS